jgi:hypothetical protein
MEQWKTIEGYDGRYQISNYGRVKSVWHYHYVNLDELKKIYKEKMVAINENGKGYQIVSLSKDGKRKNHYIHRLVAEHFLDKKTDADYVNHKDFNTRNNFVGNLEWCSQKENIQYSLNHNRGRFRPRMTSTGENYIRKRKDSSSYSVVIKRKEKMFKNIQDAIRYRDSELKRMGQL